MPSFHLESFEFEKLTLKVGQVVRCFDGPFSDAVILGFSPEGQAKVSRPYAYASGVGTTGPGVLLGSETFELPTKMIAEHYTLVDAGAHRRMS